MERRRAFTLIELLVVIAVIAILAAILFPVFAQARDKARAATCLSNMKQMSLAMTMYRQDYDQMQVPVWVANVPDPFRPGNSSRSWWNCLIQPYVKNHLVFVCPSSTATPRFYGLLEPYPIPTGSVCRYHTGIGYNWYTAANADSGEWHRASDAAIARPAELVALIENNNQIVAGPGRSPSCTVNNGQVPGGGATLCWPYETWVKACHLNGGQGFGFGSARHAGAMNLGYYDGHAKWTRIENLTIQRNFDPLAP